MSTQTNSEPVPEGPKLPQELFDLIIDQSRDNRASLQQLSLVCRSFCWHARCHLFRSIQFTCKLPGDPYQFRHLFHDRKELTIDEFIRLCENPHSTWNPRVVKKLEISPHVGDGLRMLLAASDDPEETPPRTRDIFRGLVSLQLSFADLRLWNRIQDPPFQMISVVFPSIRRLSLKSMKTSSIEDVCYMLFSMPLLEEFEWIGGNSRYWSPPLENVCATRPLPNLRSFSYQGNGDISLRDLMPMLSRLPKSHLSRYEFHHIAHRADLPAISTLMTMAGSDGPVEQKWTFALSPSVIGLAAAYNFEDSEELNFVADYLCLSQNPRISELAFASVCGWPVISKVLRRFVTMSSSKSNLKSIVLPLFTVNDWSTGSGILSEMERIDEILDDDFFSGLQELRLDSFRYPGSYGSAAPDTTRPLDEKTRNARWGRFEPVLEDIEGRCVSRAVKRGIWKLYTVGKEWYD